MKWLLLVLIFARCDAAITPERPDICDDVPDFCDKYEQRFICCPDYDE